MLVAAYASERIAAPGIEPPAQVLVAEDYLPFLKERIDYAEQSIDVVMYLCVLRDEVQDWQAVYEALEALVRAQRRGVAVRVVFSGEVFDKNDSGVAAFNRKARDFLLRHGVRAKVFDGSRMLHSKIVIIDRRISIVGSHNWTYSAFTKNLETSLALNSEKIAGEYARRLEPFFGTFDPVPGVFAGRDGN